MFQTNSPLGHVRGYISMRDETAVKKVNRKNKSMDRD